MTQLYMYDDDIFYETSMTQEINYNNLQKSTIS